FGLGDGGDKLGRGVRPNVVVEEGTDVEVDVLLTKIADVTCARSPQAEGRYFHTATLLQDGRVLLVGGANTDAGPGTSSQELLASQSAELFDPGTGTFAPAGTLSSPRMFHSATLLYDGRVAIAGGAQEMRVERGTAGVFPLQPQLVLDTVEIWDPGLERFDAEATVVDPEGPRVFHAATLTSDGYLLLTGGIPAAVAPYDLSNAMDSTTLCGGKALTCTVGPAMQRRRAGHHAVLLDESDVIIIGGSIDASGDGHLPEVQRAGDDAFALHAGPGFTDGRSNLFFAALTRYETFRALLAGGLRRDENARFSPATVTVDGVAKGPAYVLDGLGQSAVSLSAGPADGSPLSIPEPSFLGGVAALPDGLRAVVAGGFRSLDLEPSDQLAQFTEASLTIAAISVGGQTRKLREARGGLTALGVDNGTVLFAGGASPGAEDGRFPNTTAELFTDAKDPTP
ncbi:MAG: kelch repeat-containing protein, partial [Myxococcota bacterium]